VRVLTLNLWGVRGDWDARRRLLREGLHALDPDLVAFVEAIKTDDYDQSATCSAPNATSPISASGSRTVRAPRLRAAGLSATSMRSTCT
jgi:hypothetical protein